MKKQELPTLVTDYTEKLNTFNNGEIYLLSELSDDEKDKWKQRVSCAVCFVKNFLKSEKIDSPLIPFKIYLTTSPTEIKSLIFEHSEGEWQSALLFSTTKSQLFSYHKARLLKSIREYVKALMQSQSKKETYSKLPLWFLEGIPQYVQSKKDNIDFFKIARSAKFLPPVILKEMNISGKRSWLELGIISNTGTFEEHPGIIASTSFVQFLVEKEKLGLKKLWKLMQKDIKDTKDFYRKIEKLCGKDLFTILNNYSYYIDKPFLPPNVGSWEMPVATANDFRGKLIYEKKKFKIMNLL